MNRLRFLTLHSSFLVLIAGLLWLLPSSPIRAQDFDSSPSSVWGVVSSDENLSVSGMQIEFRGAWGVDTIRGDVRPDGSFQMTTFQPLKTRYLIEVRDREGRIIYNDFVEPISFPLRIHIGTPKKEQPIQGVVTVDELLHPVPKKAMKEFERAQKSSRNADPEGAIEHLRKALEIAPGFVEAHNALGVKWMILGEYAKAVPSFEEAIRLRPQSGQPLSNLAMALHSLNRDDEAEPLMRRALQLEPGSIRSRYALALVLIGKGRSDNEPMDILHEVADQIPEAHLQTAGVLARQANYREATREVKAYLESGDKAHIERAREWLRTLAPLASNQ